MCPAHPAGRFAVSLVGVLLLVPLVTSGCRVALPDRSPTPTPTSAPTRGASVADDRGTGAYPAPSPAPIRVTNASGYSGPVADLRPRVQLVFSADMVTGTVLAGLRLTPNVPITTTWPSLRRLVIQPATDLAPGDRIRIAVTGGQGVSGTSVVPMDLQVDVMRLMVLERQPWQLAPPDPLVLRVNYSVSPERMATALRLDPAIPGSWRAGKDRGRVAFRPSGPWPEGATVRLSLAEPVVDSRGQTLYQPPADGAGSTPASAPAITFTTRRAASVKESATDSQHHPLWQPVALQFDRPMAAEGLAAAVVISPTVQLATEWNGMTAILLPERGYFDPHTDYVLRIGTGVRDKDGQPVLRTPLTWRFRTGSPLPLVSFGTGATVQVVDAAGARTIDIGSGSLPRLTVTATLHALPVGQLVNPADAPRTAADQASRPLGQPAFAWSDDLDIVGAERAKVHLPAGVAPGPYRLTVGAGGTSTTVTAVVASHRLVAKYAPGQVTAWATDAQGDPAGGLPTTVYGAGGRVLARGITDALGGLQLAIPAAETPTWVVAEGAGQFAAVGLGSDWSANSRRGRAAASTGATPRFRGLVYTDRPIYRPGQRVYFKGVVRGDVDGAMVLPTRNATVTMRLKDPRGNTVQTWPLTPSDFGTVAGDVVIADGAPLGDYQLELAAGNQHFVGQFGVEDYVAPDLEVTADAIALKPGAPVPVQGTVRYRFGQPAAGAQVTVLPIVQQEEWTGSEAGTGALRWSTYGIAAIHAKVDADGRYRATLPAEQAKQLTGAASGGWYDTISPTAGVVGFEITADDGSAPTVSHLVTATVPAGAVDTAANTPAPATAGNDALRLTADKAGYRPGDTAHVLIQSPVAGPALLTVERGQVRARSVVTLTPPRTEVLLPIASTDAPNVFVSVHSWQPSPAPQHLQSSADGTLVMATLELPVEPVDKALSVTVAVDPPRLGPGATARVTVRVADHSGRPTPAEVSLAVADEAVLALRRVPERSLLSAFYGRRPHEVATFQALAPRRRLCVFCAPEPEPPRTGGGGGGPSLGDPRSDFQDTALWRAALVTDARGVVTVDVPLPDNLTRWRVVAVAITRDTRLGRGEAALEASQALVVQPLWPRILVEGDTATLAALVQNLTNRNVTATVGLQAAGIEVVGPVTHTVGVRAHDRSLVTWPARASEVGNAQLTVQAASGKASDAVRRNVPVRALVVPEVATSVGSFIGTVDVPFERPADALPDGALTVRLSRSLGGTVLQGLDYLTGFPYGCVEQTLSKALPNAVVAQASARLGVGDAGLRERLATPIAAGIQRLYGFQHADGGWGWWAEDPTDDYQTAWVLYGLGVTRAAGFQVDDAVIQRGAAYLTGRLDRTDPRTRAFALYALAGAGRPVTVTALSTSGTDLDPFSRAALALALHAQGDEAPAGRTLDALLKGLKTEGDRSWWPVGVSDGTYKNKTMASDVRSTALGLSALLALRPEHAAVPRIASWLSAQRTDHGWGTTNETAFTILALVDYLAARPENAGIAAYSIRVNDRVVGSGQLGPGALTAGATVPAGELPAGTNHVAIAQDGEQSVHFTVHRAFALPRAAVAAAGPITVTRAWRRPDGTAVTTVKQGDLVDVHLGIESQVPRSYVMVEDFLPAGLEALNPRLDTTSPLIESMGDEAPTGAAPSGAADHMEVRRDRVSLFLTDLPAGATELRYLARATRTGHFTALPTEAAGMYDPSAWGRSTSAVFEVR
jgi:uncharacterized protein YfaS (alpha-2-macroglobulin family)